MNEVFRIASSVSTPLSLAGIFAAIFLLVSKQVLSKGIFPKLSASGAADIIKHIINCLFVLSLVAMLLGFSGWIIVALRQQTPAESSPDSRTTFPAVVKPSNPLDSHGNPASAETAASTQTATAWVWQKMEIIEKTGDQKSLVHAPWTDIFWIGATGWLSGSPTIGGGGGSVGTGILLKTTDAGADWSEIPKSNINSGQGEFRWGPCGIDEPPERCQQHYLYKWNEVGPINSILFMKWVGETNILGRMATATGVYESEDGGDHWNRTTPVPGRTSGFALVGRMADIEGFHQIYAVGWLGIIHWPNEKGQWEFQLPTYSFPLNGIAVNYVNSDKEVWAVGASANMYQSVDPSSIYYNAPRTAGWEILRPSLLGIKLKSDQSFNDLMFLDNETLFIVGGKGLILKGVRTADAKWTWNVINSDTDEDFSSITSAYHEMWIVGNDGIILSSQNKGETWTRLPQIKDDLGFGVNLTRVSFFDHTGWIVGTGVVLKASFQH